MKTRFNILRIMTIVLILGLALTPLNIVMADGPTIVSVTAPAGVNPGEQFIINIAVEPGTAIAGMQFELAFDPSILSADNVAEGDLLTQGGASIYFNSGTIDNVAGTISDVAGAITTPGQSVTLPGTFATITFTAGSQGGTSTLTLSEVVVGDVNGQAVETSVVNGQIVINQAPVLSEIGAKSSDEGAQLIFTITADDTDGDPLVYTATGLPEGSSFDVDTQTFTWTTRYDQAGIYSLHFEVSDGNLTDSEDVAITIAQLYDDWDVNGDGAANVLDMVLVGQRWGQSGLTGWVLEDTNEDGNINVLDLIIIGQHWTG